MKKIVFMDDVLDAVIERGKTAQNSWSLTMKEIREALDTVPEIDLKITKVAPVQHGRAGRLRDLAHLFQAYTKLWDKLPPCTKKQEAMLKFTDAMGAYLEIMEGTDDEGMGNEDSRA